MTASAFRISRGLIRFLLPVLMSGQGIGEPATEARALAERGIPIRPNGAVADAGWALARLNDGDCMTSASFAYPETTTPVRLYLIDSGVAHTGAWFSRNANLKSFRSQLIRATEDPQTSSAVAHGTRMLSLIAGPETGAALGTPVHVVNYNIYPGPEGASTTAGRLADAIYEAIDDHGLNPSLRSVICIANGSSFPGAQSAILEDVIEQAVEAGITVVVSAGNEGGDASDYIPAAYGTREGVICTGASGQNNAVWKNSNTGAAVDLFAPGEMVRTLNLANPQPGSYDSSTGTSPATALTAAAALIRLSLDPSLTPAQVEAALTETAAPAVAAAELLVQVQPDPEGDSDADGTSDLLETFSGSDPANAAIRPDPMSMTRAAGQAQLSFGISSALFDPASPYVLTDGAAWKVRSSANLKDWEDAAGTLAPTGPAEGGVIPMSFTLPGDGPALFLRIEVTPAP